MQATVAGQLLDIEDRPTHRVWGIGLKHEHGFAECKPAPGPGLYRRSEWVTHRMKLLRDFQSKLSDRPTLRRTFCRSPGLTCSRYPTIITHEDRLRGSPRTSRYAVCCLRFHELGELSGSSAVQGRISRGRYESGSIARIHHTDMRLRRRALSRTRHQPGGRVCGGEGQRLRKPRAPAQSHRRRGQARLACRSDQGLLSPWSGLAKAARTPAAIASAPRTARRA